MCGIAGILNVDGRPASGAVLRRMTRTLRHRGPDGEGFFVHGPTGLGHQRLAILDPTPAGHQPMQTEDGRFVLTYNGEIYNFENLRIALEARGHVFRSRTDTEVVLRAFREWGTDCVEQLNGMFAFAVWDACDRRLVLARDRYGIKPLYYVQRDGAFLFASEIKALLAHPSIAARVSPEALNEYFSFQNTFTDLTLFDGIRLLPPATVMTIDRAGGAPTSRTYWDFDFQDDHRLSEEESEEAFVELFEQAVNRQLVADVEVGSYLSGGIDSGAITSVAARSFDNLKTFTCGFDLRSASGLELSFDEREKAEYLSYLYGTEHYQVVLKAGDMERIMPQLIWHLEDLRVGQCYPNYYISRLASKFVKVTLSGAGGDELFAGYPWRYYRAVVNADPNQYVSKYYRYWQRLIPDHLKPSFFQPDLMPRVRMHATRDVFSAVMNGKALNVRTPEDYVNRSLYFEAKTFLHGLLVVEDKLSMAHSLETRVPFLDNDLVDFAARVPVRHKLRNLGEVVRLNENEPGPKTERYYRQTSDGKILLRNALERYVPHDYANGRKQGFSAPDGSWFKGESIDYIRQLLFDPKARMYEYIQPETAQRLMLEHFTGTANRRLLIWSLLCFEWWLRLFMDGSTAVDWACAPTREERTYPLSSDPLPA
jgi:asparagine synthase (glutamine-hydrolysing)